MTRWFLIMLLLCCWTLPLFAQQMRVENFSRLKRYLWNRSEVAIDKQQALLDFMTTQSGFAFVANGKQPVTAEEVDDAIQLKLPDKTRFVTIKHPDFGQYIWRVPVKHLKRKKHYCAVLQTLDEGKEYKLPWQWVVFDVSPENAILHIDSATYLVRQESTVIRLPVGKHSYKVESPFYETVSDTFELTDSTKLRIDINLQPVYSYLTIRTPWTNSIMYVDEQPVGVQEGTSFRLSEGDHYLSVFVRDTCCYNAFFSIGRAEKKVIELTEKDYNPQPCKKPKPVKDTTAGDSLLIQAPVTLIADNDSTEIWLNREKVGNGKWSGMLGEGFYIATTRKNQLESEPTLFWVNDEFPQELNLAVPQTSQGMLNIYSNVVGADIYVNEICMGVTPCVVQGLPSACSYDIRLQKQGYREARQTVRPKGNELLDVYIKMKYMNGN